MGILYSARDVSFHYQWGAQTVGALDHVSVELNQGGFYCLAGPSGSGKTTLLNLLGLIENSQSGTILFDGLSFGGLTEGQKNRIRRHRIGFVFQNFNLFPALRADENVEFFLQRQGLARKERRVRVDQALEAVGLSLEKSRRPADMSGGQRQRVAIARALAKNPQVILADEPTASLDQATGREIVDIFANLAQPGDVTVILSSHDQMVMSRAREVITLRDGRIA